MNSHRAIFVVILFLAVLLALWAASTFLPTTGSVPQTATAYSLTLRHASDGVQHTYSGAIPVLSNCDTISTTVSVAQENPPHAYLALQTLPGADTCPRHTSDADFSISFSSAEIPQVTVTVNGSPVPTTIVETN